MNILYCRECNIELNTVNAVPLYGVQKERYSTPFHQICKSCLREQRHTRKVNIVREYKIEGCSTCGYKKNMAALEFHHVNGNKDANISNMIWKQNSIKNLRRELDKCILLCSNCHRELHNPQLNI